MGLNRGIVVRGKTNKVLRLLLTLSIVVFFNIGSISILGQYLTRSKVNIGLTSFFITIRHLKCVNNVRSLPEAKRSPLILTQTDE